MAILWQKKVNGEHYEVRTAGNSHRLYKNGVCHSQYNSHNVMTGSIWDLLLLPACYQVETPVDDVLVLGVGGGAVIRQLHELCGPESVTGVELDGVHLEIARRYFGLDMEGLQLYEAEAVSWLQNDKRKYGLIIEDMFSESARRPVRAVSANQEWLQSLVTHLRSDGTLIMNFASSAEFRQSVIYKEMAVRNYFADIYQLTMPTLDNVVIAMHKKPVIHTAIHRNLTEIPQIQRAFMSKKLKYRIRKIRQLKNS